MDLGFFILMGIVGGLLGATFNCLNKRLAKYRMRNVHPKPKLVRYLCFLEFVRVCLICVQCPQCKCIDLEDQWEGLVENLFLFVTEIKNEASMELK